jgi:quercetin dioxygenase-like cupin family protein
MKVSIWRIIRGGSDMKQSNRTGRIGSYLGMALIGFLVGGIGGQVLAQIKGPTEHKGISVTELGIINEESLKAQLGIEGFILRMRAVTVEPGGHIKEHSHATRPGLVKMVSGTWIEGHPDGREKKYQAGEDVALLEEKDTVHWIYNRGNKPATGVVCGIQPSK